MSESSQLRLLKNRIKARPPMVKYGSSSNNMDVAESIVEDPSSPSVKCTVSLPPPAPEEVVEELLVEEPATPLCSFVGNNVQWMCISCNNECLVVTRESRCICGHRRKEHAAQPNGRSADLPCSSKSCACRNFFYIVGEGSWILRCQCKHKHIEHDSSKAPYSCKKCKSCAGFDSPWVCNCGHRWNSHTQRLRALGNGGGIAPAGGHPPLPDPSKPISTTTTAASRVNFAVRRDGIPPANL